MKLNQSPSPVAAPLVLIVEDEPGIATILRAYLERDGLRSQLAEDGAQALQAFRRMRPDLVLLDIHLPTMDGIDVLRSIRDQGQTPVIMVTALADDVDKLVALRLGADDYVVKPFNPAEVVARVRAVLRRKAGSRDAAPAAARIARFGGWTANFDACTLTAPDGEAVELSSAENDLLRIFVQSAGRVLSRATLLDLNSQNDLTPFDRSIDVRVSRLRRKLREDPGAPAMIRTVYGAGYVFAPKVEWMTQPA